MLFARLAVMFAAGYIVISIVGLIMERRWLAELGPFKASEPISLLDEGMETIGADLAKALVTIERLEQRIRRDRRALARNRSDIGLLLDRIATLEREKDGN